MNEVDSALVPNCIVLGLLVNIICQYLSIPLVQVSNSSTNQCVIVHLSQMPGMPMVPPGYAPASMPHYQPVGIPAGQPVGFAPSNSIPGMPSSYPTHLPQQTIQQPTATAFQPVTITGTPPVMSKMFLKQLLID